jgi:SAM-dependent methyltransferase
MEKEHFEELLARTGHTWWGRTTPAGQRRDEKKIELFKELIRPRPGERLLEVGCGSGEFTVRLKGLGLKIWAFDLTTSGPARAARDLAGKPGFALCAADLTRLPFPDASFDIVFGVSILHHVPLDPAFREIIRVSRPGARFFFSEPNLLNPQVLAEKKIGFFKRRTENSPGETAFIRSRLKKYLNSRAGVTVEVQNIDFLHPALPARWIGRAERLSDFLEKTPLVRTVSGSLAIWGSIGK